MTEMRFGGMTALWGVCRQKGTVDDEWTTKPRRARKRNSLSDSNQLAVRGCLQALGLDSRPERRGLDTEPLESDANEMLSFVDRLSQENQDIAQRLTKAKRANNAARTLHPTDHSE